MIDPKIVNEAAGQVQSKLVPGRVQDLKAARIEPILIARDGGEPASIRTVKTMTMTMTATVKTTTRRRDRRSSQPNGTRMARRLALILQRNKLRSGWRVAMSFLHCMTSFLPQQRNFWRCSLR